MTAGELLQALRELGATARADGDALHIRAPTGAIPDGLRAELRRSHPEVDVVVHRGARPGCPLELGVE